MAGIDPIGGLIARYLAGIDGRDISALATIRARWGEAVGPELARVCRPETLGSGKLTIVVAHPTWAQNLGFLKDRLLANLRGIVPDADLTDAIFRVGRIHGPKKTKPEPPALPPLTGQEAAEVDAAVAGVADEETKAILRTLLAELLRRDPGRKR